MGLAVELLGRCCVNLDSSYQELSRDTTENQIITDLADTKKRNNTHVVDETFENCMHESLHYVLAYCAQIVRPQFLKLIHKKPKNQELKLTTQNSNKNTNCVTETSKLTTIKPPINLKCIKNHAKLQQVLERGSKNTLILLKTSDPTLKKDCKDNCTISSTTDTTNNVIPVKIDNDAQCENNILKQSVNFSKLSLDDSMDNNEKINNNVKKTSLPTNIKLCDDNNSLHDEKWLEELISNTAVLYCTAIGIHQDDFVNYLDTLSAGQCLNWLNTGY